MRADADSPAAYEIVPQRLPASFNKAAIAVRRDEKRKGERRTETKAGLRVRSG